MILSRIWSTVKYSDQLSLHKSSIEGFSLVGVTEFSVDVGAIAGPSGLNGSKNVKNSEALYLVSQFSVDRLQFLAVWTGGRVKLNQGIFVWIINDIIKGLCNNYLRCRRHTEVTMRHFATSSFSLSFSSLQNIFLIKLVNIYEPFKHSHTAHLTLTVAAFFSGMGSDLM